MLGRGVYPKIEGLPGGQTILAHGTKWDHGLFAHAPSSIEYALDGAYQTLTGSALMHNGCQAGDGAVFRVLVDGNEVYTSPAVTFSSKPVSFEVDVYGGQILTLSIDNLAGGDCDWSIWGDPMLVRASQIVTPTPDPSIPCSGVMPERNYMFMDCSDVLRIRALLKSRDPGFLAVWNEDLKVLDQYRSNLPTTYKNTQSAGVLWSGQINVYLRDLTLAYLVTGNKDYADDIKYMLDLLQASVPNTARSYTYENPAALVSNPRHGVNPNISVLFAYLALRDTDYYDDKGRAEMDDFMIRQGETAMTAIPVLGGHVSIGSPTNRNVTLASAILATAVAASFPDDPRAQELYPRARAELDWMLANWWQTDGGWGEDTDSYGINRLDSLLLAAETVRKNLGEDMYAQNFNGQSLGNICRYYLRTLTPEGVPPALNDSTHISVDPGILRLCAYRSNDPELAWAADQYRWGIEHAYNQPPLYGGELFFHELVWAGLPPAPQSPDFTSIDLDGTGAAILRSGWEHSDSYALLQHTKSLVHAENSFGTLYLFDGGPWMVGNGYHLLSFNMGAEGQSTRQHNTITMDNRSQQNIGGELRGFADLGQVGVASVQGQPYSFADFQRTLIWIKDWHQWLVVDDVGICDGKSHSAQLRWYVRANAPGIQSPAQPNSWKFTRSTGTPDSLDITMLPPKEAAYSAVSRQYPWEQWISDAHGVEMELPGVTGSARIVTALTSADSVPEVTRSDEPGDTHVVSALGDEQWAWFLPVPGKNTAGLADASVTGLAGCLHLQRTELRGYCLLNGTSLLYKGQPLVKSTSPAYVEVDLGNRTVTTQTDAGTIIAFYWPGTVTSLLMDGSAIPFSEENGLIRVDLSAGHHRLTVH